MVMTQARGGGGQGPGRGQHHDEAPGDRGGQSDHDGRDALGQEQRADCRDLPVPVGLAPQVEVDGTGDNREDRTGQDEDRDCSPDPG
jgi:hypothetical protein